MKEILNHMPQIDCGEFLLRQVERDDYKDLYEYGSNPDNVVFLPWGPYTCVEDAVWSIENVFLNRPEKDLPVGHAIVWKANDKMIGTCDVHTWDKEKNIAEIGYVVNKEYWGKGIATRACIEVVKYAFEVLGVSKVEIAHHNDNIGSKRVIEKCGFEFVENRRHPSLSDGETMPFYEITKDVFVSRSS